MYGIFGGVVGIGWNTVHAQDGSTALLLAAWMGHSDCVRLLLDAGADKETTDKVRTSGLSAASSIW